MTIEIEDPSYILGSSTSSDTRDLIVAEIRGDEDARAALMDNLPWWQDGLVALIQDVDAQFTTRRAEADQYRVQCQAQGPSGKQAWFAYDADHRTWRGAANGFKRRLVARLREVKEMIKAQNIERQETGAERWKTGVKQIKRLAVRARQESRTISPVEILEIIDLVEAPDRI